MMYFLEFDDKREWINVEAMNVILQLDNKNIVKYEVIAQMPLIIFNSITSLAVI